MRFAHLLATYLLCGVAMAAPEETLKFLDVGGYAELASRPNPESLTIAFIPSLASNLLAEERRKGSPLTESEVLAIRDRSTVTVVPGDKKQLEGAQGYKDVDPRNCWAEWQALRIQLVGP